MRSKTLREWTSKRHKRNRPASISTKIFVFFHPTDAEAEHSDPHGREDACVLLSTLSCRASAADGHNTLQPSICRNRFQRSAKTKPNQRPAVYILIMTDCATLEMHLCPASTCGKQGSGRHTRSTVFTVLETQPLRAVLTTVQRVDGDFTRQRKVAKHYQDSYTTEPTVLNVARRRMAVHHWWSSRHEGTLSLKCTD